MRWLPRVVGTMIAVLLPAGVLAATTVDAGTPAPDRRVGAAGFAQEGVVEERVATPASSTIVAPVPTVPVPPMPATTAPSRPAPTTPNTTARPAPTSTTMVTLLPGVPLPGLPTIPILQPPTNNWSRSANGVTAKLRMEPATPVPGQPVRFFVDVAAPEACCAMNLSYGDGVVSPNPAGGCDSPTTRTATLTHTFTAPGDNELLLVAMTFPCEPSMADGVFVPPPLYGTSITACISVGLRLAGSPACAPFNHFGPGTVYSAA